jgi:SNF2 family DNA or RNA helicase
LDLPAIEMQVVPVPMGKLHAEIYASLKADFSKLVKSQRERTELASWGEITMYLLEAATNPALLPAGSSSDDPIEFRHPPLSIPDGSSLRELIAQFASYETPEKFVQIALMVRQLTEQGRKVLIWSNFVRNLITLERMFRVYEPALIHGGIPSELTSPLNLNTRENELIRFREDDNCKVLLANPAALGEGVSLHQMCHDAIYLERSFNAGQYLQSVDRIHRLGLEKGQRTTVTFLISTDTIDEAVSSRISIKARRLGVMLDDPGIETMSLPDEEDVGQPIDTGDDGDIAALFAHLRGEVNVGE